MTEDDTYRNLIKTPFCILERIYDVWVDDSQDKRLLKEILEEHHWTLEEFNAAYPNHPTNEIWI